MVQLEATARPMSNKTYLTEGGYQKLQSELDYLRTIKRREIADYLHQVMDGEDPNECDEYLVAKNEQALVEGRIRALERLLCHVEIIQPGDLAGEVRLGSQVTVLERGRLVKTYTIVGPAESDARRGLISDESPMGRALLGQLVGEIVEVVAPDGKYKIRIIGIT